MKTLKAKMFKARYWTDNMLSKERKIQSIFSPLEVVSVKFRAIQTTHLKTLKKKRKNMCFEIRGTHFYHLLAVWL